MSQPNETTVAPRDTRRAQTLLAAGVWTAVGVGLSMLGLVWVSQAFGLPWALLWALPFVGLGFLKGHFLLDRMAKRTLERIEERGPGAAWWGFFSGRTWVLIAAMIVTGQVVRLIPIPRFDVGFVYVAVGTALILASHVMWLAVDLASASASG